MELLTQAMVREQDGVFVTKSGLTYRFVVGVPTNIPNGFVLAAKVFGATLVNQEAPSTATKQRQQRISQAIAQMIVSNQDLAASGRPNLSALRHRSGYKDIDTTELDQLLALAKT